MCWFANVFIPSVGAKRLVIPNKYKSLIGPNGEQQKQFVARFKHKKGTVLTADDGHCLCGFDDWPTLRNSLSDLLRANGANWLNFIYFWANKDYALGSDVSWDPSPYGIINAPEEGKIYTFTWRPDRLLSSLVGKQVSLKLKGGKTLYGKLERFDVSSRVGSLQESRKKNGTHFSADRILDVEASRG